MPRGVYIHKPLSEETKRKISEGCKGIPTKGCKGRHPRTEFKKGHPYYPSKVKVRAKGRINKTYPLRGKNHHNWKGGVSTETNNRVNDRRWIALRKIIYQRDQWKCQICGEHCHNNIQCHHILAVRDGGTDNKLNLTTLNTACHRKIEFSKNAEFWKFYLSLHLIMNLN